MALGAWSHNDGLASQGRVCDVDFGVFVQRK